MLNCTGAISGDLFGLVRRQGSTFRVDPKIAEIVGVGEGTTSQPVPRCPRRCRSCGRSSDRRRACSNATVMMSVMMVPFFPYSREAASCPKGQEPRSCSPNSRGAAGERGQGDKSEGITRPKGRRKIHLERIRVDPARSEIKASGGRTGRPIFPLQGRGGSAPFPH